MERAKRAVAVLAAVAILSSGCALFDSNATPRDKYIDTQEAFIAVLGTVVDAKRAGIIPQDRYDAVIIPLVIEGNQLLDEMAAMVSSGSFDQVELLRSRLIAIVARLQLERA